MNKKAIDEIVERLKKNYQPQKIILFGSYACGTPRPDSDVDLLVVKETGDRFIDRYAEVRGILSDPSRKVGLDIMVMTPAEIESRISRGDQFMKTVLDKGILLYAA